MVENLHRDFNNIQRETSNLEEGNFKVLQDLEQLENRYMTSIDFWICGKRLYSTSLIHHSSINIFNHTPMNFINIYFTYQSSSSMSVGLGAAGITTYFSFSFIYLTFWLQIDLWLGQSDTWQSLEQYQILLHFAHLLNAYFVHLPHLNPSIRPSTFWLE